MPAFLPLALLVQGRRTPCLARRGAEPLEKSCFSNLRLVGSGGLSNKGMAAMAHVGHE